MKSGPEPDSYPVPQRLGAEPLPILVVSSGQSAKTGQL